MAEKSSHLGRAKIRLFRAARKVTAHLYVGADNQTGSVDLATIRNVLDKWHNDGYTLYQAQGYWYGRTEDCAVCVITATTAQIKQTAVQLRDELNQEAVGVQYLSAIQFV